MGYRKRGDSWEVNVTYKGHRAFATVATEEEAKQKLTLLKAELINKANGVAAPPPEAALVAPSRLTQAEKDSIWSLKKAIAKTFEVRWNGTKSEDFYAMKCKVLTDYFGEDRRLDTITTDDVDAFKAKLLKDKKAQATINHALVALSMVFKIAMERCPVAFKRPTLGYKRQVRGRIRYLKDGEEESILALLKQWGKDELADLTVVLVDTGLRPSECLGISTAKGRVVASVDFREGLVHVHVSKTPSGIRGVPMTPRVKGVLERRCLAHPNGPVFPLKWSKYENAWERVRAILELTKDQDFVPYCLRHTFATRLVQRGTRIEVISKLLGHASLNQTMVYAKLGAAQYLEAIKTLEKQP